MIDNDKTVFLWTYDIIDSVYSIALHIYFNAWKCHYSNRPASSSLTSYHFRCLCSNSQLSYTAYNRRMACEIWNYNDSFQLNGDVKIALSEIKTRMWFYTEHIFWSTVRRIQFNQFNIAFILVRQLRARDKVCQTTTLNASKLNFKN